MLNTLATTAATAYVTTHATTHPPSAAVLNQAALTSYTTAFAWSGTIFLAGAIITALVYRRRVPVAERVTEPAVTTIAEPA